MESFEKPSRPAELFGSDVLTNVSSSMYKTKTKDEAMRKSVIERNSDMHSSISSSLSQAVDQPSIEHQKQDFVYLKENLESELQRLKDVVHQLNEESSGDFVTKRPSGNLDVEKYEKILNEKRVQAEMYVEQLMKADNENCSIRGKIEMLELNAKSNDQESCCSCSIF